MDDLLTLIDYAAWATNRLLHALAPLNDSELKSDLGSSHGGIQGTLAHLHGADRIWLARLKGETPPGFPTSAGLPALPELEGLWAALYADLNATVSEFSPETVISYANLKGETQRSTLAQIVRHVVNHGTHHRAQVVTLLRQLGHAPPNTDLIAFYRTLNT